MFSGRGDVILSVVGQRVVSRAASGLGNLRMMDTASVLALRVPLERYAARPKKGIGSVDRTLQIIDALRSRRPGALREAISKWPVKVVTSMSTDSLGRPGIRKDFFLNGVLKLITFVIVDAQDHGLQPADEGRVSLEGEVSAVAEAGLNPFLGVPYCEWEDEISGFTSGDCATAQEQEELLIALVAAEADVESVEAETVAEVASYCQMHQEDYETCAESRPPTASPGNPMTFELEDDMVGQEGLFSSSGATFGCGGHKWLFGGALAAFVSGVAAVVEVGTAATATAAAIVGATGWLVAGVAAVVGTGYFLVECVRAS